jgi:hypothetical protein
MWMITIMVGMTSAHSPKILDMVLLIKMEMDLRVHWWVNRSQEFFLWDSGGWLKNYGMAAFWTVSVPLRTLCSPNSVLTVFKGLLEEAGPFGHRRCQYKHKCCHRLCQCHFNCWNSTYLIFSIKEILLLYWVNLQWKTFNSVLIAFKL